MERRKRAEELQQAVRTSNMPLVERILCKTRLAYRRSNSMISTKTLDLNFQDEHGMSSIHDATITGNIEILQLLINNGINPNLKDNKGLRPLHYAAWQGRPEPVAILVRHGAQIDDQSSTGETPLHLASQYGHQEIVQFLLYHHADPTILNRRLLTPLDLACEQGHLPIVHLLVHHPSVRPLLLHPQTDHQTPLHLAAKNGHTDIIRLLLLNGFDINRLTMQDGSALHVACRNGRYEAAKLLLECGIDLNLYNAYEQTADEVVIKNKAGNDIKRLIKEFSEAVLVQAIRSHTDHHVGALNFVKGDCITVLERHPSGPWRGFILQEDLTTRTGYFPSNYVQLFSNINHLKNLPHDSEPVNRSNECDSMSLSQWFQSRFRRESSSTPSYRPSGTTSTDHGRIYDSPKTMPLSSFFALTSIGGDGRSMSSSSESKSSDVDKTSYCSSTSSLDESNTLHIHTLLRNGVSSNEIVLIWLREFSFEHYASNFLDHGYDIQTIVRMTPEDLTAIGITHPLHRRKIKAEIARLHLPDPFPDFIPGTLYDWLCYLHLEEYYLPLMEQNYRQLSDIMSIAWEDLEEIGITRLGHQKRFMLGVKRLIDLDKGSFPSQSLAKMSSSTIRAHRSTLARCNSLENNDVMSKSTSRTMLYGGESSNYATLRKGQLSPTEKIHSSKKTGTLSFRLPPPLSSPIMHASINHYPSLTSSRTRSLENITTDSPRYDPLTRSDAMNDELEPFTSTNPLSSSTESTHAIPFANEHFGTIKQRSPPSHSHSTSIYPDTTLPRTVRTDRRNVLSDIDTMLSDLNRELDQMLDYKGMAN